MLCVCMLLGTTFAWFTDSVSSAGNKIQSGNLSVDLELLDKKTGEWVSLKNSSAPIFDYDKWEPGYVDTKILKIENEGSLSLKWVAKFYSEEELSILAEVIDVYVLATANEQTYPADRSLAGYTYVGNLKSFINSIEETTNGTLEAGESAYLGIALKMREDAGNEYQGLSLGGAFDIRIYATQNTSEFDSFDNLYDEMTEEDALVTRSKALSDGETEMNFPMYYKGSKIVDVNVPADAIADPTKPVTVSIDAIDPETSIVVDDNVQAYAYDINVTNLKSGLSGNQLVTVSVTVPRGLVSVKAYHKGHLIDDAEYDEVTGTVTFKTDSFSPYVIATETYSASSLADLRDCMQKDGALVRLAEDITIDLSKGSADRSADHVLKSGSSTYYNAVNIVGQGVALDLNGHTITVYCGDAYNSNSDVGALFFVGANGSLNIDDSAGGGFIKMRSSVYAVWAPYADPSFVDIYGGVFIADSYAGDPIGTSTNPGSADGTMKNENSNRCLIYAGTGGNINVYGGYFLYNNTPNDVLDRNNGAFNAKDFYEQGVLITIHDGVMLINDKYRQDPSYTSRPDGSYDNYSVVLAEDHDVKRVELETPVTIDGEKYDTWYQVQRNYYNIIFMNTDGTTVLDTVKISKTVGEVTIKDYDTVSESIKTFKCWVNAGADEMSKIPADNTKDIVLYPSLENVYTARYLDEGGNVISTVTFTAKDKLSVIQNGAPSSNPASSSEYLVFDHWEVRSSDGSSVPLSDYKPSNAKGDITIYPYYNIKDGGLGLTGVDVDGDGKFEYYTVEAVGSGNFGNEVTIPGYVNGLPVKIITDLSSGWATNVQHVVIKEGVEEISKTAFAGTTSLTSVELPSTITKIASNAFYDDSWIGGLGNLVGRDKKIEFTFNGTKAEWDVIAANSPGWEQGLATGTTVHCTDGVYKLTRNRSGLFDYTYTWTWTAN